MKRLWAYILCIILLLSFSFSAEAEDSLQSEIDALITANQISTILENHSNVTDSQLVWVNGDVCYQNFFMNEQGQMVFESIWPNYQSYARDDFSLELENDEVTASVALGAENFDISKSVLIYGLDDDAVFSADESGLLTVSSVMTLDADSAAVYALSEGDKMYTIAMYSPESHIIEKYVWRIQEASTGRTYDYATAVVHLDLDIIHPMTLKALMDGECYNLKVVYEDGKEKAFQIPAGTMLMYYFDEGAVLYDDQACLTPHAAQTSEMLTQDITLYYKGV